MKMKKQIEYRKVEDYYFPVLKNDILGNLGKYGRMRQTYLMNYEYPKYMKMNSENSLYLHLHRVEAEANDLYNQLLNDFKRKRDVTEELKEKDQMRWLSEMENIHQCIEEIVIKELIFR